MTSDGHHNSQVLRTARGTSKYTIKEELQRAIGDMRKESITIRRMRMDDLSQADSIMRTAFGTYLGLPEPLSFMGDADFVKTRFTTDPSAALTAEIDGILVGSNFLLNWGSVGVFGPLTIDPKYWDRGIAKKLLEETMKIFGKWGMKHVGLFTFAQSSKHVHLYQNFGFWPQFLTAVMSKQLERSENREAEYLRYSALRSEEKSPVLKQCAFLTSSILEGLDLQKEIEAVESQRLGDTILLMDDDKNVIHGLAICHSGPDTEAGSGNCYVKFAAAESSKSPESFDRLLDACEHYARSKGAMRLTGGANAAREKQYRRMIARGFKTDMLGVAMHNPNENFYNRPDVWIVDDWR